MTLQLTKKEFKNLTHGLAVAERRRPRYNATVTLEREAKILKLLHAHKSNMDIKRTLHTSDVVINKIKKANGLWGA